MNTSDCNHDTMYEIDEHTVLPFKNVCAMFAHFFAYYPSTFPENEIPPFYLYDKSSNVYTLQSVGFECTGVGTMILKKEETEYSYSLEELFTKKRELFDNLVKRICHQSPELVQATVVSYRQTTA